MIVIAAEVFSPLVCGPAQHAEVPQPDRSNIGSLARDAVEIGWRPHLSHDAGIRVHGHHVGPRWRAALTGVRRPERRTNLRHGHVVYGWRNGSWCRPSPDALLLDVVD